MQKNLFSHIFQFTANNTSRQKWSAQSISGRKGEKDWAPVPNKENSKIPIEHILSRFLECVCTHYTSVRIHKWWNPVVFFANQTKTVQHQHLYKSIILIVLKIHTHTPSPSLLNHIMYVLRKDLPNSSALEEIHPLSCLLSALRFVSVILNERIMQYVTWMWYRYYSVIAVHSLFVFIIIKCSFVNMFALSFTRTNTFLCLNYRHLPCSLFTAFKIPVRSNSLRNDLFNELFTISMILPLNGSM